MAPLLDLVESVNWITLLYSGLIFGGFFLVMFLGSKFLPGIKGLGEPLKDSKRKEYKLTGLLLFLLVTIITELMFILEISLSVLIQYFWSLFIVANVFSVIWSLLLFFIGRKKLGEKKKKGFKGILHDLWFGAELNPTWFGVDLKMFAYQPSLIGLSLINYSFAFVQYESLGYLLPQMWLYQIFWWVYLFTHYVQEEFMLSTWDIIAENFGFMLVWGDTVYVPFFYSIGGWFIAYQLTPIPIWGVIMLTILYLISIWIFRGSNIQKYNFKKNPQVKIWFKTAKTLENKILVSGFWGIGRKLNYTGEILLYFTIIATTWFISPIPFVLPLALLILLSQRAWRDDRRCKKKYGELWKKYCKIAKFKMIPFLY